MIDIIEKIVNIICPILALIISIISLIKSNEAIKQVNKIKIESNQNANNITNSQVTQNIK